MKVAQITIIRTSDQNTSSILLSEYIETIPFWKITWAPQHIIFHTDMNDENQIIAYRADRIFDVVTEDLEQ
jgi:hypothetical protein